MESSDKGFRAHLDLGVNPGRAAALCDVGQVNLHA